MTLILRRLEQWSFGPDGPRWRRPQRASYTRLHSSLISKGRETMGGRGLVRDDPTPQDWASSLERTAAAEEAPRRAPGHVTRDDQRSYVKIEALLGRDETVIHSCLRRACGSDAVQRSTVYYWASVFREGTTAPASQTATNGRQGSTTTYGRRGSTNAYGRQGSTTTYSLRM